MKREAGKLYLYYHTCTNYTKVTSRTIIICFSTGNNQLGQLPTSSQLTEAQVSVFSLWGTTQSDTINCTAGNTQTNPAGSVYQRSQGTAETTLTSSQLPTRSEGPNTRYQIDPAVLLQAIEASNGFHQTCIMSPSLYTGGTPLVTNFPMSEHSSQLAMIGQSLPLLP